MRLTPDAAREAGFEIDTHCYPPIAYKGPRFQPTETRECFTELEADMLRALRLEQKLEEFDCPHDAEHRCRCARREEILMMAARQARVAAIAKAEGR